ncbi:uncharacterized protein LOC120348069 [Styela clava]|uniref:uncharacterized protein LOC120348069 n=1 Tax=Styela clava TaxID=7725 RepID=UPI001939D4F2|nr:uncharacterized protein LOC120348069 [Styela clava]
MNISYKFFSSHVCRICHRSINWEPKSPVSIASASRLYSGSPSPKNSKSEDNRSKEKWWSISNEWKIITTIGIGIASWFVNAKQDRIHSRKQMKMNLVSSQLKELYGPLYGNRIVAETSYRAAMKEYGGLRNYLEQARKERDAEMIKRWRSYVWTVLYPLDEEAVDIICKHAHLIAEKDFPEEFDTFLKHIARMRFVMEQWKNEKGNLESTKEFTEDDFLEDTNSSGIGGSKSMINHLQLKCKHLRKQQQEYVEDISVDNLTLGMLNKIKI